MENKIYESNVHAFNTDIAKDYGVNQAIIIQHLIFWIQKNVADKKNHHPIEIDGKIVNRTFTYNSRRAFADQFPYFNEEQIRRILEGLIKIKVLVAGNFNTNKYDRTIWYAFSDEVKFGIKIPFDDNAKTIRQNSQMETADLPNPNGNSNVTIPDTNTDVTQIETHINLPKPEIDKKEKELVSVVLEKKDKINDKGISISMKDKNKLYEEINEYASKFHNQSINNVRVFDMWYDKVLNEYKEDINKYKWTKAWYKSFLDYVTNHQSEIQERLRTPSAKIKHPNLYQQMRMTDA